jgi:hypothetical protein
VHRRIIGAAHPHRGFLSGLLTVLALGALLATRPATASVADPATEARRVAALHAVALTADRALEDLIAGLRAAIDAGRTGSALIVEGERDPGAAFDRAAGRALVAEELAVDAAAAVAELQAVLSAVAPAIDPPPAGQPGSLQAIAAQLTTAGQAGGPFVERRLAADATLSALADALQALNDNQAEAALRALDRAHASRAVVADWPRPPTVLPFWLHTTGDMIAAARDIAKATIARDPVAAASAGRAYERAAEGAHRADIALAIAISEVGNSLAVTPMRGLADALSAALIQRETVQAILATVR